MFINKLLTFLILALLVVVIYVPSASGLKSQSRLYLSKTEKKI